MYSFHTIGLCIRMYLCLCVNGQLRNPFCFPTLALLPAYLEKYQKLLNRNSATPPRRLSRPISATLPPDKTYAPDHADKKSTCAAYGAHSPHLRVGSYPVRKDSGGGRGR